MTTTDILTERYLPCAEGRWETHSLWMGPTTASSRATIASRNSSPPVPMAVKVRSQGYLFTCAGRGGG